MLNPMLKLPGLTMPEVGKIKIGIKGEVTKSAKGNEFRLPKKLDHFLVVKNERDASGDFLIDKEVMAQLDEKPKRIPVMFLYNELQLNFRSRLAFYSGRKILCKGDGEKALRRTDDGNEVQVSCPCDKLGRGCKPSAVLSVVITKAPRIGGVYKFRTTSWNTINGITASFMLIQATTGGPIAGLPLDLVVNPKTVVNPENGKEELAHIVSIEFPGSFDELRALGLGEAQKLALHQGRMDRVEKDAARLLASNDVIDGEDEGDFADEFHPPEQEPERKDETVTRDTTTGAPSARAKKEPHAALKTSEPPSGNGDMRTAAKEEGEVKPPPAEPTTDDVFSMDNA